MCSVDPWMLNIGFHKRTASSKVLAMMPGGGVGEAEPDPVSVGARSDEPQDASEMIARVAAAAAIATRAPIRIASHLLLERPSRGVVAGCS